MTDDHNSRRSRLQWLAQLQLPPTAKVETRLAELTALEPGYRFQRQYSRWFDSRGEVLRVRADLELCRERDAIQPTRPDGCRCLGGGMGWMPVTDIDGNTCDVWDVCGCADGRAADAARRRELVVAFLPEANVPARFKECSFEAYLQLNPASKELISQLDRWPEGDKRSLLLYGDVGRGKTGLAASLLLRALEHHRGLFINVPQWLAQLRQSFDTNDEPRHSVNKLLDAWLLVLDDIGAEHVTDWTIEQLYIVIGHRHDEDLPTIFTSNLSTESLAEMHGQRIANRISEMADVVEVTGPNLRFLDETEPKILRLVKQRRPVDSDSQRRISAGGARARAGRRG